MNLLKTLASKAISRKGSIGTTKPSSHTELIYTFLNKLNISLTETFKLTTMDGNSPYGVVTNFGENSTLTLGCSLDGGRGTHPFPLKDFNIIDSAPTYFQSVTKTIKQNRSKSTHVDSFEEPTPLIIERVSSNSILTVRIDPKTQKMDVYVLDKKTFKPIANQLKSFMQYVKSTVDSTVTLKNGQWEMNELTPAKIRYKNSNGTEESKEVEKFKQEGGKILLIGCESAFIKVIGYIDITNADTQKHTLHIGKETFILAHAPGEIVYESGRNALHELFKNEDGITYMSLSPFHSPETATYAQSNKGAPLYALLELAIYSNSSQIPHDQRGTIKKYYDLKEKTALLQTLFTPQLEGGSQIRNSFYFLDDNIIFYPDIALEHQEKVLEDLSTLAQDGDGNASITVNGTTYTYTHDITPAIDESQLIGLFSDNHLLPSTFKIKKGASNTYNIAYHDGVSEKSLDFNGIEDNHYGLEFKNDTKTIATKTAFGLDIGRETYTFVNTKIKENEELTAAKEAEAVLLEQKELAAAKKSSQAIFDKVKDLAAQVKSLQPVLDAGMESDGFGFPDSTPVNIVDTAVQTAFEGIEGAEGFTTLEALSTTDSLPDLDSKEKYETLTSKISLLQKALTGEKSRLEIVKREAKAKARAAEKAKLATIELQKKELAKAKQQCNTVFQEVKRLASQIKDNDFINFITFNFIDAVSEAFNGAAQITTLEALSTAATLPDLSSKQEFDAFNRKLVKLDDQLKTVLQELQIIEHEEATMIENGEEGLGFGPDLGIQETLLEQEKATARQECDTIFQQVKGLATEIKGMDVINLSSVNAAVLKAFNGTAEITTLDVLSKATLPGLDSKKAFDGLKGKLSKLQKILIKEKSEIETKERAQALKSTAIFAGNHGTLRRRAASSRGVSHAIATDLTFEKGYELLTEAEKAVYVGKPKKYIVSEFEIIKGGHSGYLVVQKSHEENFNSMSFEDDSSKKYQIAGNNICIQEDIYDTGF